MFKLLLDPANEKRKRRHVLSIANNLEQAGIFVDAARDLVHASPILKKQLVRESDFELEFTRNRFLKAMPCSARAARGYPAEMVVLDEFAFFFQDEVGGQADAGKIWQAVSGNIVSFRGPQILVLSTPLGGDGLFYELATKAADGRIKGAVEFHASTLEMNPSADVESARTSLSVDGFNAEFLAEWVHPGGSYFDMEDVEACTYDGRCHPSEGVGWIAAFDPAESAPAALVIVGRAGDEPDQLLVGHIERWVPDSWKQKKTRTPTEESLWIDHVIEGVADACHRFGVRHVFLDQHRWMLYRGLLQEHGLGSSMAAWGASQGDSFEKLRLRLQQRRIQLPADPQMRREFTRVQRNTRSRASSVKLPYSSTDGHCDIIVALSMAVERCGGARGNPNGGRVGTIRMFGDF